MGQQLCKGVVESELPKPLDLAANTEKRRREVYD